MERHRTEFAVTLRALAEYFYRRRPRPFSIAVAVLDVTCWR